MTLPSLKIKQRNYCSNWELLLCFNSPDLPSYKQIIWPPNFLRQFLTTRIRINLLTAWCLFPLLGWKTGSWQWNPQGTDGTASAWRVGTLGIRRCSFPNKSWFRHPCGTKWSASPQELPPFFLSVYGRSGRHRWKRECRYARVGCVGKCVLIGEKAAVLNCHCKDTIVSSHWSSSIGSWDSAKMKFNEASFTMG